MTRTACTALSHSAITVVSAFATGHGVTIGLDIPCEVTVQVKDRDKKESRINVMGESADPHGLITACVLGSIKHLGVRLSQNESISVSVNSDIPSAVGLKSSSAVSVALVKGMFDLFSDNNSKKSDWQNILKVSCLASIKSGASLTGAYDDAAAGLIGGLVFSDNRNFRLLRHEPLNSSYGSIVKILIPIKSEKLTSSLNLADYHRHREEVLQAIEFARAGILAQAMLMNSIIHAVIHRYSLQPIISSIAEGATACGISGKGPSVAAICPNDPIANMVESRWTSENPGCHVVTASVTKPTGSEPR
jgi:shikimate kinase